MKKILITGVAGNIGSSLAKYLLNNFTDIEVIGIDNLLTGNINNLPKDRRFKFYKIDCNFDEYQELFNKYGINYIFHYAACAGVELTLKDPLRVINDIEGIKKICNYAVKNKVFKIAYASSSEVYGEPIFLPLSVDNSPLNATLPYAQVKCIGESIIKSYNQIYGLNYQIFRFFNTYGINQSDSYVLMKFIKLALKNEDITIYGDGTKSRTFLFINDNLKVTTKLMFSDESLNSTINIGSDKLININELAKKVIKLTNSKSKIKYLKERKFGDVSTRQPDNQEFIKILQSDIISLDLGILEIINSLK